MRIATRSASLSIDAPDIDLPRAEVHASDRINRETATALVLILVATLMHGLLAVQIGLGVDESYTLVISRELSWSYFDHPPLHYWIVHLAVQLLGEGRAARLPFVLLSAASSWFLFLLTKRLFGARAGLWALAALNMSAFFTVAASSWILPDGPLDVFLLAAAAEIAPLVVSPQRAAVWQPRYDVRWFRIGIWCGLAALSKYHAALFCMGLIGLFAASSRLRPILRTPGPYIAAAITGLMFSPVLIWNAAHGWSSFLFQAGRASPSLGWNFSHALSQLAGEAGLLLPWIFVPLGWATIRAMREGKTDDRKHLCLWLGLPTIVLMTLIPVLCARGFPHWTMPGWLMLFPLLGAFLDKASKIHSWPRWLMTTSAGLTLILGVAAALETSSGWLGAEFPGVFSRGDPTIESVEWHGFQSGIDGTWQSQAHHDYVLALNWRDGGKIGVAIGGSIPVHVYSIEPHGLAQLTSADGWVGSNVLIVGRPKEMSEALPSLRTHFASIRLLMPVIIGRNGRHEIVLERASAIRQLGPHLRNDSLASTR